MTANKKLFCDCNSSLRNGCDYDEAVAVRILATATICDDIRCVVVESDGKESVCEATLRDDVPHCEET